MPAAPTAPTVPTTTSATTRLTILFIVAAAVGALVPVTLLVSSPALLLAVRTIGAALSRRARLGWCALATAMIVVPLTLLVFLSAGGSTVSTSR